MSYRFIQANINRSWPAYVLLTQRMAEEGISVGIIAEPPVRRNPNTSGWLVSNNGLAAIMWTARWPYGCILLHTGRDFVAARMYNTIIISCYISPRAHRERYLRFLDELGDVIGTYGGSPIIVAGDFNARSPAWNPGISHNFKGELLEEWAAERDLRLLNAGEVPTCVGT